MAVKTVLIVDDELHFVRSTSERLAFEGYEVRESTSAAEALAEIDRARPDLILLDIMMPGMDGVKLFEILRSRPDTASVPVVFISVRRDLLDHPVIANDRRYRILAKPFEMEALLAAIRESLEGT